MNNTILNTRVKKINYKDGLVSVTTEDGKNYHADHVIFTASLGVLKENYDKLFTPSLPEKKINAIKVIIYFQFDNLNLFVSSS